VVPLDSIGGREEIEGWTGGGGVVVGIADVSAAAAAMPTNDAPYAL
jgi:hypothetical protein